MTEATSEADLSGRGPSGRAPAKSASAFRTISEVAEEIGIAQHVLRFWETKFTQVRPIKRAGGRRFYRPEDIEALREIRALLYDQGFTIRGAQKHLRSQRGPALATRNKPPRPEPALLVTGPSGSEPERGASPRERLWALRTELANLQAELRATRLALPSGTQ